MISKMICLVSLLLAVVAVSFAQSSGPRVNLSLIVTDKNQKSVSTLRKEDVQVFEDKVQQTIISIEPDERPVDFALVIDRSGSLRSLMPSVAEAAYRIITNKQPADQFFIETFVSSNNITKIQDFTDDTKVLTDALKFIDIEGLGQSRIIYQSSKEPAKPEYRKVEVKLSSTSGDKLKAIAPRGYYVEAKDVNKQATEPKSP